MIKNSKGITLIALVITIIVLLILAGVAIQALKDGGILGQAQNAEENYTIAQEKELIRLAVNEWNIENETTVSNLDFNKVIENALKGQKVSIVGENDGPVTVKFNKTGNTYTVTPSGEIVKGWYDNGDGSYTKGDITIKIGETTYTNAEVQEKLGASGGTYKGTWTVIGVEGEKIKLVSTNNVKGVYTWLGEGDPNVFKKDENGNQTTTLRDEIVEIFDKEGQEETNLNLEKAIWSYQHVVETLDNYAKATTGIPSARSITLEDIEAKDVLNITNEKKVELSKYYGRTYNYFYNTEKSKVSSKYKEPGSDKWSSVTTNNYSTESGIYIDEKGKIVIVDSKDEEITLEENWYTYTNAFTNSKFAELLGNDQ